MMVGDNYLENVALIALAHWLGADFDWEQFARCHRFAIEKITTGRWFASRVAEAEERRKRLEEKRAARRRK